MSRPPINGFSIGFAEDLRSRVQEESTWPVSSSMRTRISPTPVQLPNGGRLSIPVQAGFNGFVHMLEGEANFGANRSRARRGQIAVLGPGGALAVEDTQPGTRFVLMAGKPYGEAPIYNGPYVD